MRERLRLAVLCAASVGACSFDSSGGAGGGPADGGAPPTDGAGQANGPDASTVEPPDAAQPVTCDPPWVADSSGCHRYVVAPPLGFDAAQQDCAAVAKGGHLVVMSDGTEISEVTAGLALVSAEDRYWIGFWDPPPDDNVFEWVTGAAVTVTNFAEGEPSNSGDCVNVRPDGTWGDRLCTEAKKYVCEKNDS